jgi:predicted RNA-binding protein (virulence factor B family)
MAAYDLLGDYTTLRVQRISPHGALLIEEGDGKTDAILLPRSEVPGNLDVGDKIEVFIALDSDDRPIATLKKPKLSVGEVAFLTVTDVVHFGAFCDWGLPKELLVPNHDQTEPLRVGDREPIGLIRDHLGRLSGTMRVAELLHTGVGKFEVGEWVEGEAWRKDPEIGVFVIIERSIVGLLPAEEPNRLKRGEAAKFRVTKVLPDRKVVLTLRAPAHEAIDADADLILAALRGEDPPRVGDHSDPDEIRRIFGLSKKAFKRAVGGLLRKKVVVADKDGFLKESGVR